MRKILALVALALGLSIPSGEGVRAARDSTVPSKPVRLELLVLEVESCDICTLVRNRIQPRYEMTNHARTVPMRYMDITRRDETKLGLTAPVDVVPTIVLLRDGKEINRFVGYMGPENFLALIGHALRTEGE